VIDISFIQIAQLVVDFGVVVLIWLVQLVIYPGLTFYADADLKSWHSKYTGAVTIVVLPLMMSQLILSVYSLLVSTDTFHIMHTLLVICAWVITFGIAVPLHQKLEKSDDPLSIAHKLVRSNKWRAILWTLVFITSLVIVS